MYVRLRQAPGKISSGPRASEAGKPHDDDNEDEASESRRAPKAPLPPAGTTLVQESGVKAESGHEGKGSTGASEGGGEVYQHKEKDSVPLTWALRHNPFRYR